MIDEIESISHPSKRKGRKVFPALCSMLGTLILLGVIAAFLPLTVPRLMGYGIYEVVSGSMEPEIPVGSVIYVKAAQPDTVEAGDIIAFYKDESVITHRVEENRYVEGEFITKGDANEENDMNPVGYNELIGRVCLHYPVVGAFLEVCTSNVGKVYLICFAACGAMLNMLAGRLRNR